MQNQCSHYSTDNVKKQNKTRKFAVHTKNTKHKKTLTVNYKHHIHRDLHLLCEHILLVSSDNPIRTHTHTPFLTHFFNTHKFPGTLMKQSRMKHTMHEKSWNFTQVFRYTPLYRNAYQHVQAERN